jgi:2-keto-3-deoxy-L-rhamnonate aldolase RhmA
MRGAFVMTDGVFNAESMAYAGFDYVCVDTQHGLMGYEQALRMLQAISGSPATPIARTDLALTLGSPLHPKSSAVYEAIETIREACETAGITPGIHGGTGTNSAKFLADGFRLVTVTQDYSLVAMQARAELEVAGGSARPF